MPLPLYKTLEIHEPKKAAIWAKLANAGIGKQPVVVDIRPARELEHEALVFVDLFMDQTSVRDFPYPLYIITNISQHPSLDLFPSPNDLPIFYRRKNRPLNMKENTLMAKVSLKQNSLDNVNIEEVRSTLGAYAKKHKMLHKKQTYLNFLNNVLHELEGK
ncbi:MAG: hypothetical protein KC478_01575 [Bacteriovoracaceae bacterium]|nr:hypothetical protein [Bacteriovoracaceae bacterium]